MKFNLLWKNKFPVLEYKVEALLHMLSTTGSKLKFNGDFPVHVTEKKKNQQNPRKSEQDPDSLGLEELEIK